MRALILSIALIILSALPTFAADVLILQASRNQAFAEAAAGFRERCDCSSRTVVLSDYAEVDVARLVREERARLVLAVGDAALSAARKAGRVPVVSLMALAPMGNRTGNVTAIAPVASPEQYLRLFKQMGRRRIGIVTDTSHTDAYLRAARQAADTMGLELTVREARTPKDALTRLAQLKDEVDALWMVPDTSVITSDTMEAMARLSLEERMPLLTFSEHYLAKGATAALKTDAADMGRQAGEAAADLLKSGSTGVNYPRKVTVRMNDSVAETLGVTKQLPR